MPRIPTISEINELNRRYWEEQIPLSNRRIADEAIRETALARLFDDQARIPVYFQAPLEKLLADAERDGKRFLSQQGCQRRWKTRPYCGGVAGHVRPAFFCKKPLLFAPKRTASSAPPRS